MKKILYILILLNFQLQAQVIENKNIDINPYDLYVKKISDFKGVKYDNNICGNGCAWIDKSGFLRLKDSSNFIYFKNNENTKSFKILSLFPNLYFINLSNGYLYTIKFKSKVIPFYDENDYPYSAKETETNCAPCNDGANAEQSLIYLPNNRMPLLYIKWIQDVIEAPQFYVEYEGIKIIDFNLLQCVFDDINKITFYQSGCDSIKKYYRTINIKNDTLKISESFYEDYSCENGKSKGLKERKNITFNDENLKIRIPGFYIFDNEKYKLIK